MQLRSISIYSTKHSMNLEPMTSPSTPFFMEEGNAIWTRAHWSDSSHRISCTKKTILSEVQAKQEQAANTTISEQQEAYALTTSLANSILSKYSKRHLIYHPGLFWIEFFTLLQNSIQALALDLIIWMIASTEIEPYLFNILF